MSTNPDRNPPVVSFSSHRQVETCIEDLQDLRSTAKRVRDDQYLPEKDFQKIRATVNDTITRLQIWAPEAGTANIRGIKTIGITLEELHNIIQKADGVLREHNKDRSPRKDDSIVVQHLDAVFKEVDKCLHSLQSVSQVDHARPDVRSSFLLHSDLQMQLVTEVQRTWGKVRISALDLFWKKIPVISGSKNEDMLDLKDGVMVKSSDLKSAAAAIRELLQLWSELDPQFATTWTAAHLPKMTKICLILRAIDKRQWIENFIAAKKDDDALTLDQPSLEAVLSHPALSDDNQEEKDQGIEYFLGEQYRVEPRKWGIGTHAPLYELEPLPLEHRDTWPDIESGYATVVMVKEVGQGVHVGEIFAHKKGKLKESTPHLTNELQCLEALGDHRHIVQCVKTYTRGEEFGLLIKPVAEHNLWKLLGAYCEKRYKARRPAYKKILLYAFGCLSSSLVFIHGTTRHKDIKPQNILWYRPKEANDKRGKLPKSDLSRPPDAAGRTTPRERNIGEVIFLWADFGLAHSFNAKDDAKTYGGHQGTGRYSAPEYRPSDSSTAHDTPSDVFALGCVFLEILSVLLKATLRAEDPDNIQQILAIETVPPDRHNQGTDTSSATLQESQKQFRHKLPAINEWIAIQLSLLPHDDLLVPLLIESQRMIREKPEKRPEIKEVVQTLFARSDEYFCKECWLEQQQELLKESDLSGPVFEASTVENPSIQTQEPLPKEPESQSSQLQATFPGTAPTSTVLFPAPSPSRLPSQIPLPQAKQPQSLPLRKKQTYLAEPSEVRSRSSKSKEIRPPHGQPQITRPQATHPQPSSAQPAKSKQQQATLAAPAPDEKSSRRRSWFRRKPP